MIRSFATKIPNGEQLLADLLDHLNKFNFAANGCLGFNGELVKSQVANEWWLTNVCRADEPVFTINQDLEHSFVQLLPLVEKLPFSAVSMSRSKEGNFVNDLAGICKPDFTTVLRKVTFCLPSASTVFFHKQQRDRKIWWRKFSAKPDRFKLTEINYEGGNQSVEIRTEFPWETYTIETVQCLSTSSASQPKLLVKDGRKSVEPHVVISECQLDTAAVTFLCDAFDPINEATAREIMRFHRKLAPVKIAFAVSGSTADVAKELSDLSLVLARRIRKIGITCLLWPDLAKKSLESQFLRNDAMGIPYTIVCNDKTLKDGIMVLRSRDTTLKEQSHVGVVVSYVEKLMRNY